MKLLIPVPLTFGRSTRSAQTANYVNFIRQNQQGAGVVWDMPVEADGPPPSALTLENGGALFQLWTIEQTAGKDYLLDQKLVGAYLPTADIKMTTLDPDGKIPAPGWTSRSPWRSTSPACSPALGFPQAAIQGPVGKAPRLL